MLPRKQNSNKEEKTKDDIYVEAFAREFFGTNEPADNDSLESEKNEAPQAQIKEIRKNADTHSPKGKITDRKHSERETESVNKREMSKEGQRNGPNNNNPPSSDILHARDSRQTIANRFLELRNEFLSLSERLHHASMPAQVSKRLTQVLSERQKLVKLLLDVDAPDSSDVSPTSEEKRFHGETRSRNLGSKESFGMPKKTKSVHWSDEHLGGSIIQDPSMYIREPPYPNSTPEAYHKDIINPPPKYQMVDHQTQTHPRRDGRTYNPRNSNQCYCNMKVNHDIEYVKDILNEAAELRREACYMLWRAHYLEHFFDADGMVKHVYRSNSNVPTIPRYSRVHR